MTESIPIILIGAAGRMGRMIVECAAQADEPCAIAAAVDRPDHPCSGMEYRTLIPTAPAGLKLAGELPGAPPEGAVSINFSLPDSIEEHMAWAEKTGAAAVVGTTGMNDAQLERIRAAAERVPALLAPNMSVGVNVLFELAAQAVRMLGPEYDVEIAEIHHRFKKDAPSGTARKLAEVILEARGGGDYARDVRHGREGIVGERPRGEIGMHALRGGDVVGEHTASFAALGERIELTHRAHTRETFARGALRAARWLAGRKPGRLYGMKDVLGL